MSNFLTLCLIFHNRYYHNTEDKNKSKNGMNTETRSYFVGNSDNILEALKQGNLSWEYLRLDFFFKNLYKNW